MPPIPFIIFSLLCRKVTTGFPYLTNLILVFFLCNILLYLHDWGGVANCNFNVPRYKKFNRFCKKKLPISSQTDQNRNREPSFVLRDCQTFSFEHAHYSRCISACVRLITAICAHIPVLYIISTHLRPMMPKHSNAVSISIETGPRPMRGAVNIFAVVMETWTVFTCHLLGLNFYLLLACV